MAPKAKPRRHYVDANGKKLPGVTTVIGTNLGWSKDALIGWAHKLGREGRSLRERDDAATLGSCVHDIAAALLGGEPLDVEQYAPEIIEKARPNGERVAEWVRERYEVVAIELPLTSPTFGVGGTIDLVLRDKADDALVIGDLKTGKSVHDEVAIQLGAYVGLWEETGRDAIACGVVIHAPFGGSITAHPLKREQLNAGGAAFMHLRALHALRDRVAL